MFDGDRREEEDAARVRACPLDLACRSCPPADPDEAAALYEARDGHLPLDELPW